PNLSGPFWIQNTGDETEEAPRRTRDRYVASFLEARREFQWTQLGAKRDPFVVPVPVNTWDSAPDGKAAQGVATIRLGGRQSYRIRLSNFLRRVENAILAHPDTL